MSPLLVAVIYFVAWRQCRRIGQAVTETAAWVAGYLATFVVLTAAHVGRPDLISLAPESWAVVVPIGGGFIAMKLSHWLWRRRGGHLEPARHPFAARHWARALRAMLRGGKPRPAARSQPVARRQPTNPSGVAQPAPKPTTTSITVPRAAGRPGQTARWVRVARAMLDTEQTNRRKQR